MAGEERGSDSDSTNDDDDDDDDASVEEEDTIARAIMGTRTILPSNEIISVFVVLLLLPAGEGGGRRLPLAKSGDIDRASASAEASGGGYLSSLPKQPSAMAMMGGG